jgi:hypothetical protein
MKALWMPALALATFAASIAAAPSPATSPAASAPAATASPTPDPKVLARAKEWFHRLQTGQIDLSQVDPTVAKLLSDPQTLKAASAEFGPLGDPVTFEQEQTGTMGANTYYVYLLTFGDGKKFEYLFVLDTQGKISGLRLTAPQ